MKKTRIALRGNDMHQHIMRVSVSGVLSFDVISLCAYVCEKGDVRELLGRKRHVWS